MQEGAHRGNALPIVRFLHHRREAEIDQWKGWRHRCQSLEQKY